MQLNIIINAIDTSSHNTRVPLYTDKKEQVRQ